MTDVPPPQDKQSIHLASTFGDLGGALCIPGSVQFFMHVCACQTAVSRALDVLPFCVRSSRQRTRYVVVLAAR